MLYTLYMQYIHTENNHASTLLTRLENYSAIYLLNSWKTLSVVRTENYCIDVKLERPNHGLFD